MITAEAEAEAGVQIEAVGEPVRYMALMMRPTRRLKITTSLVEEVEMNSVDTDNPRQSATALHLLLLESTSP